MLELDHVFVIVSPNAPEAQALIDLGLTEGVPNSHPGQGTANRRFFFHNAMLELLYIRDEAEAKSSMGLGLWQRSRYHETGMAPFGICLRSSDPDLSANLPFDTFSHQPEYLPVGRVIQFAMDTHPTEPMVFYFDGLARPDAYAEGHQQPLEHGLSVREITHVHIAVPNGANPSEAVHALEHLGAASFTRGDDFLLEIIFDDKESGSHHDFRPVLPLVFYW